MTKPELYIKTSILAQRDADYVLNKYKVLLEKTGSCTVLDVGCGPGNVTCEKILTALPKTTKVIGVDANQDNLQYAKKRYQKDNRVSFHYMSILTEQVPEEYVGAFELIVSLYCLHLVGDHKRALNNIYKMLKPGGTVLLSFIRESIVKGMYQSVHDNPKYHQYMRNFNDIVPVTQSVKYYISLCDELGFDQIECEDKPKDIWYPKDIAFGIYHSANLFNVPQTLEEDFTRDQLNYFKKIGNVRIDDDGNEFFYFPYTLLVITAKKRPTSPFEV